MKNGGKTSFVDGLINLENIIQAPIIIPNIRPNNPTLIRPNSPSLSTLSITSFWIVSVPNNSLSIQIVKLAVV